MSDPSLLRVYWVLMLVSAFSGVTWVPLIKNLLTFIWKPGFACSLTVILQARFAGLSASLAMASASVPTKVMP